MKKIRFWLALLGMTSILATPAQAGNKQMLELLKVLRDNGTIKAEQYESLLKAASAPEEMDMVKVEEKDKDKKKDVGTKVSTEGGLKVETKNKKSSFEIGGHFMVDMATQRTDGDNAKPLTDGTEIRKAEFEISGTFEKNWEYEIKVNVADNQLDLGRMWAGYHGFEPLTIKIGQMKTPFSLEAITSSKYSTFMERAMLNALIPGERIALNLGSGGANWSANTAIFGEGVDPNAEEDGSLANENWGAAARVTYAPLIEKEKIIHLGVSLATMQPDRTINEEDRGQDEDGDGMANETDTEYARLRARPEIHVNADRLVDTGRIYNIKRTNLYGLEAAGVWGPFSLQGEYVHSNIQRELGNVDLNFDGYYIYASWFITGESRTYRPDEGEFSKIKPRNKSGAVELAARYSVLDLNDGAIDGGLEKNITFGVNWYLNSQVRLMANYINVDTEYNNDEEGNDPHLFGLRCQWVF